MLVIGDVTGRGARAASVTAQARYTLRTAAALTGDPLVALATLNRALLARGDSALCSVAALAISEDPLQPVRARRRRPPAAAAGRRRGGRRAGRVGPGARRLRRRRLAARLRPSSSRASSWSSSPTGSPRPAARRAASARSGCAPSSAASSSPVQVVQRLEGALQAFTDGELDDDVAILALTPASCRRAPAGASIAGAGARWPARADSEPAMDDARRPLVERLFDAFNRRDAEEIVACCDEDMEFFAVTAEEVGPQRPLRRPRRPARLPRRRRRRSGRSC